MARPVARDAIANSNNKTRKESFTITFCLQPIHDDIPKEYSFFFYIHFLSMKLKVNKFKQVNLSTNAHTNTRAHQHRQTLCIQPFSVRSTILYETCFACWNQNWSITIDDFVFFSIFFVSRAVLNQRRNIATLINAKPIISKSSQARKR